jgi:hypothetical protein
MWVMSRPESVELPDLLNYFAIGPLFFDANFGFCMVVFMLFDLIIIGS